eukprot:jgi/Chrpa1/18742/Chrysochromulina_OHIO_Genome00002514-RA
MCEERLHNVSMALLRRLHQRRLAVRVWKVGVDVWHGQQRCDDREVTLAGSALEGRNAVVVSRVWVDAALAQERLDDLQVPFASRKQQRRAAVRVDGVHVDTVLGEQLLHVFAKALAGCLKELCCPVVGIRSGVATLCCGRATLWRGFI